MAFAGVGRQFVEGGRERDGGRGERDGRGGEQGVKGGRRRGEDERGSGRRRDKVTGTGMVMGIGMTLICGRVCTQAEGERAAS